MVKNWIEPEDILVPKNILESVGGHPLVAEILYKRGINDPESVRAFLNPDHYAPSPPTDFPNLKEAADRIDNAILNRETILVWGDFDVDGQTSTTLLVEGLHDLGGKVVFYIPLRETEGHGVNPGTLGNLLAADEPHPFTYPLPGQHLDDPTLLITCDTGISEHEAVSLAKSKGLDVIITDHHELTESLPDADAIINPHLLPDGHPLGTLPGVGVAYKLVEELFVRRGDQIGANKFLDLVALGIVADLAEQVEKCPYRLWVVYPTLVQNLRNQGMSTN